VETDPVELEVSEVVAFGIEVGERVVLGVLVVPVELEIVVLEDISVPEVVSGTDVGAEVVVGVLVVIVELETVEIGVIFVLEVVSGMDVDKGVVLGVSLVEIIELEVGP